MNRNWAIRGFWMILAGAATLGGHADRAPAHEIEVLASRLVTEPGSRDTVSLSWGLILPVDIPVDAEAIRDDRLHTPTGSASDLATEGHSRHDDEVTVEEEGLDTAEVTRHPSLDTAVVDEDGGVATIRVDRAGTRDIRARKVLPAAPEDRSQFDVESFTASVALEVLP